MLRREVETPSNVDNLSRYVMETYGTPLGQREANNPNSIEPVTRDFSTSPAHRTERSETPNNHPIVGRRSTQGSHTGPLEVQSGVPQEFQSPNDVRDGQSK